MAPRASVKCGLGQWKRHEAGLELPRTPHLKRPLSQVRPSHWGCAPGISAGLRTLPGCTYNRPVVVRAQQTPHIPQPMPVVISVYTHMKCGAPLAVSSPGLACVTRIACAELDFGDCSKVTGITGKALLDYRVVPLHA